MDNKSEAPVIDLCDISIYKWHNTSRLHSQPLIADKFLAEIETACYEALNLMNSISFGMPGKQMRYMLRVKDLADTSEIGKAKSIIEQAVINLRGNWQDVITDAQQRLGNLFNENELPDPSSLDKLYGLNFKKIYSDTATTLNIYQDYSLFYIPPPEPNMYDAIEWGRIKQAERDANKE